jgi:hypothetical protein
MAAHDAYGQLELTLGAGANTPMGDYGDQMKTGYAVVTGLGIRVMPLLVVGAELSFYGNSATDEALAGLGGEAEVSGRIQQYAGMAKLLLPVGNHNVFAKGVVGNYRATAKVSSSIGEASASNSALGYGLGGGLLINGARNSAFFLDVTYHRVSYDGSDIDTTFFTFSAGAVIRVNLFE